MKKASLLHLLPLLLALQTVQSQTFITRDTLCLPPPGAVETRDRQYKTAVQIDELDIPIAENLAYRVFLPANLAPGERRPLVMMVHGGGFVGGDYADFFGFCEALAARGFVAASIQYRLCKRNDCLLAPLNICGVNWHNSFIPSAYASACDANDALRDLLARAAEYHIDPAKIVVGGGSAGAFTALNMAFLDQDEAQSICPTCGTWPDYLAEPLDPVPGISGVLDLSGALFSMDFLDADEAAATPVFIVHGTHEEVVPYGSGPVYCCACAGTFPPVFGADSIATRLAKLGGSYFLYTGEGFGHDIGQQDFALGAVPQMFGFMATAMLEKRPERRHFVVGANPAVPFCVGNGHCFEAVSALPRTAGFTVFETDSLCVVGTSENPGALEARFFPNPAHEKLTLQIGETGGSGPFWVEIFSPAGKSVLRKQVPGAGRFEVPLDGVLPGMYFLRVSDERGRAFWVTKISIF